MTAWNYCDYNPEILFMETKKFTMYSKTDYIIKDGTFF